MNLAYLSREEYQHIVRIVGNDIPGDRKTIVGLAQIRGIGYNFANAILDSLKIDSNTNIGNLSEEQIKGIEKIIKNPESANFPSWFQNRRRDVLSGKNLHLITSDIALTVRNDIEREKAINSWRGFRHMYGLKVRGQRTRTTGRKGGAVGVKKGGKILPAGAPAPGVEGVPAAPGVGVAAEGEKAAEGKEAGTKGKETAAKGGETKAAPKAEGKTPPKEDKSKEAKTQGKK